MSFTNYLEAAVLGHVFGETTYTPPATWYLTAYTTAPAEDGTGGVEATGGSWGGRQAVSFTPGAASPIANDAQTVLTMPAATIVAYSLCDASTAGNICSVVVLGTPVAYDDGDEVLVDVGDLTQSLD